MQGEGAFTHGKLSLWKQGTAIARLLCVARCQIVTAIDQDKALALDRGGRIYPDRNLHRNFEMQLEQTFELYGTIYNTSYWSRCAF